MPSAGSHPCTFAGPTPWVVVPTDVGGTVEPVPDCSTGPFGRLSWTLRELAGIVRSLRGRAQPRDTGSERGAPCGHDDVEGMDPQAGGSLRA